MYRDPYTPIAGPVLVVERHTLIAWGAAAVVGAVLLVVGLLHWGTWVGTQDARMQALHDRQQAVERCQRAGFAGAQVTMIDAAPGRDITGCVGGSGRLLGKQGPR